MQHPHLSAITLLLHLLILQATGRIISGGPEGLITKNPQSPKEVIINRSILSQVLKNLFPSSSQVSVDTGDVLSLVNNQISQDVQDDQRNNYEQERLSNEVNRPQQETNDGQQVRVVSSNYYAPEPNRNNNQFYPQLAPAVPEPNQQRPSPQTLQRQEVQGSYMRQPEDQNVNTVGYGNHAQERPSPQQQIHADHPAVTVAQGVHDRRQDTSQHTYGRVDAGVEFNQNPTYWHGREVTGVQHQRQQPSVNHEVTQHQPRYQHQQYQQVQVQAHPNQPTAPADQHPTYWHGREVTGVQHQHQQPSVNHEATQHQPRYQQQQYHQVHQVQEDHVNQQTVTTDHQSAGRRVQVGEIRVQTVS